MQRPRLTSRGWGLVAGGVGCIVAARVLGMPHLWILAVAAGLTVVLGVVLAGRRRGLHAQRRTHLPVVAHGGDIGMRIVLHNTSRLPLGRTRLVDATPPRLHTPARAILPHLAPGSSIPLTYRAQGRARGRHVFGPLRVHLSDPLGITRRSVDVEGTTTAVVLPRIIALQSGAPAVVGDVPGDRGTGVPRPVGDDVGMVREYTPGDELRRIHWPATAHRGTLMVRKAESRRRRRVVILLDRTPADDFELRVSVAASIGQYFHDLSAEVRVVADPHQQLAAERTWDVQLERLATLDEHPGDLAALTATLAGGGAGGGTLVAVATASDTLATMLQRLGRNFDRRLAVVTGARRSHHATQTALSTARSMGWQAALVDDLEGLPATWAGMTRRRRRTA